MNRDHGSVFSFAGWLYQKNFDPARCNACMAQVANCSAPSILKTGFVHVERLFGIIFDLCDAW